MVWLVWLVGGGGWHVQKQKPKKKNRQLGNQTQTITTLRDGGESGEHTHTHVCVLTGAYAVPDTDGVGTYLVGVEEWMCAT